MSVTILGIESSCDETAAAVVRDGVDVLSSVVASQTDVHAIFGGVVPEIASREHLRWIDLLVEQALKEAGLELEQIDALAVTQGPGLIGALLVGVAYAKGLALSSGLPLIPVDHVHAHVHGALLDRDALAQSGGGGADSGYPCLALVVSGGHTNLYRLNNPTDFQLLAATIDDACGECFDKVAKLLGLPYPGGPHIERMARDGDPSRWSMPRMMQEKGRMAFSYSGLKTHMAGLVRKHGSDEKEVPGLCAAFQEEALGQLVRKLRVGLANNSDVTRVLIAGGVAANKRFQELTADLKKDFDISVVFPHPKHCADNGAMIAAMGYHLLKGRERASTADSQHLDHLNDFMKSDWDAYSQYRFPSRVQN